MVIKIRTQSEFESIKSSTPTTDIIRIYPRDDGKPYNMTTPWTIDSGTHIEGIANPEIKFTGDVGSEYGIIHISGTTDSPKNNILIRGLVITGNKSASAVLHGIRVNFAGKAQTTGLSTGTYSRYDSSTINNTPVNTVGVTIQNCTVQGNRDDGIYIVNSYNCTLSGNTVRDNKSAGVHLFGSNNNLIQDNKIQGSSNGIYLYRSSQVIVSGNDINGCTSEALLVESTSANNTILDNSVHDNIYHGICISSCSCTTVMGNIVVRNRGTGIWLGSSSAYHLTVSGNTVQGNIKGIHVMTNNSSIYSNIVNNNNGIGIHVDSSSGNNTVMSNCCMGNAVNGSPMNGVEAISASGIVHSNIHDGLSNSDTQTVDSNLFFQA